VSTCNAAKARVDWLYDSPAQVTVVVLQCSWVAEVEKALDMLLAAGNASRSAMRDYKDEQLKDINNLIVITRSALTKPQRTIVMVLITMDTHNRDINLVMLKEEVWDKDNFLWASQLRPRYLPDQEKIQFYICDAKVWYGLEYLGNGPRLVVTPTLTDRFYVTATQAQHLYMGCAPAGPAGTGKTESTKDLSSNLAVPIYVFKCAPEMMAVLRDLFPGLDPPRKRDLNFEAIFAETALEMDLSAPPQGG
jgi:dynein heavy chain